MAEVGVAGHLGCFIVDTGCGLTSLDAGWAASIGIVPNDTQQTVHGTDAVATSFATAPSLRVGDVLLENTQVLLLPLAGVSEHLGMQVDGVAGYDILSRGIVAIDFREDTMSILDEYDGAGFVIPVDLTYRIPIAQATIAIDETTELTARMALDLGSGTFDVRLVGAFVDTHDEILSALPSTAGPFGTGVGGAIEGRMTRFRSVRVGDFVIDHPTAGITNDRRGALGLGIFDGTVGANVFAGKRLILDYARSRVIIEP